MIGILEEADVRVDVAGKPELECANPDHDVPAVMEIILSCGHSRALCREHRDKVVEASNQRHLTCADDNDPTTVVLVVPI